MGVVGIPSPGLSPVRLDDGINVAARRAQPALLPFAAGRLDGDVADVAGSNFSSVSWRVMQRSSELEQLRPMTTTSPGLSGGVIVEPVKGLGVVAAVMLA